MMLLKMTLNIHQLIVGDIIFLIILAIIFKLSPIRFFSRYNRKNLYLEIPVSESNSIKYQFYTSIIGVDVNIRDKIYHLAKSYEYYSFVNVIYYQIDYTAVITLASKKQSFDMINYILNNEDKILALTKKYIKIIPTL
ncbi:hypothetical protein [Legionella tunisiensis]|uniref:hypothetical protein n=1 Tax=Legionella tunisiensis TaxID=1034944 RepID=UPI00036DDDBB|nr:hypothetical protein [Legionella tunisiensis]